MIVRREEWMCAQAIYTGTIHVIGEGLNEIIDFNFTNYEEKNLSYIALRSNVRNNVDWLLRRK